ncbi:putative allergen asp f 4 [Erysiphe necator]|uniref:Putative allergen asp f 4 n=1 Tax=Uncinula necator TaxID=52586 RepID=A0A0B1P0C9_UNCNE|nr:putative allergen asp f 4 [Erysiphe necator]
MHYTITVPIVLALFTGREAFCGPTHNHLHRRIHQKRELNNVNWNALDWDGMGINWAAAYAEGQSAPKPTPSIASVQDSIPLPSTAVPEPAVNPEPPVRAEPAAVLTSHAPEKDINEVSEKDSQPLGDSKPDHKVKPHHEPNSSDKPKSGSSKHGSSSKSWKNLVGASNNRKVFGMSTPTYGKEVGYVSNVGIPEGSNMIKVETASDHTFTNQFINISQEPMTVVIWNKAASPGLRDPMNADPNLGASIAPEHPALTIALEPNESQTVAFLDESVIGWAQACETRAISGGFQTTWGEAQFNTTGSGYDVSAIQNAEGSNYIMHISSIEASSCESTESTNMWITDTSTVGSGSCYIAQNTAHLITKMGGYAS